MNRYKRLCILLGVLAAFCGATLLVLQIEEHKEKIRNSEDVILELPSDSVRSLSWEYEGETLAFHKEDVWLYDEDAAFPVSEERINELLEPFQEFGVSFIIEDVEDYGQYGLNNPICTIDLATEEQSYQVKLGNYSNMDSKRYVSIGDGNVYLVQNDPLDYFDTNIRSMIANDDTPAFDHVTGIQFSGEKKYSVVYEEDGTGSYSSNDVYYAEIGGKKMPLATAKVDSYLMTITSIKPTDYVTYKAGEEDLAAYGLENPDLTITVDYTTEDEDGNQEANTFVLCIGQNPEEKARAAAEEDEENGGESVTSYIRIGESQIIYKISEDRYDMLAAAFYDDFRHSEVLWADFLDVQQIDISLDGADYSLTSEKDGDERTWFYQDEELEIWSFEYALEALSADSFTSERPSQKEEIKLTVYLDNENYPQISISLYRYDGAYCLAVVDGQPVSLVDRTAVVDLIEAVHAIVLN